MEDTTLIEVTNRDNGRVGYDIPDTNVHRTFAAGETKKISLEELKQLSYIPGGEYILQHYLIVNNQTALDALNMSVEPEYFYTEAEIRKILLSVDADALDRLEDTLNFAPSGVLDLIKKIAVEEEIPDIRKRKLIAEKTGFSVENAINVNHIVNADDSVETSSEDETKVRKVTTSTTPKRKVSTSKYKVVSEG